MGAYRKEWGCCGSVSETQSYEPEECPFCSDSRPYAASTAPAEALHKLCDRLDRERRRMRHTPGTGQNHAYFDADDVMAHVEEARAAVASPPARPEGAEARYRFLLSFLLERGVLHRYNNGVWRLRGIYGVDDSGLKGAGRTPEEALDNAIVAVNLDPVASDKFWRESCDAVLAHQVASVPDAERVNRLIGGIGGGVWKDGALTLTHAELFAVVSGILNIERAALAAQPVAASTSKTGEAANIAAQCRATASSEIAENVLVDAGSGTLRELLLDAARAIASTLAPSAEEVTDAKRYRWLRDHGPEGRPAVFINGRWHGAKFGNGVGFDLDSAIDEAMRTTTDNAKEA